MHQPTCRSTVGSHLVRYISRSSVRLSRVRRYSLSVDSQSMVGGYFPNGSPTFSRFNGRYLCGLSFDMAVDISTDSRGTMKYFSKSRRVCCGMHTFSAKTFCIKNLRARQVFRLSDFSKKQAICYSWQCYIWKASGEKILGRVMLTHTPLKSRRLSSRSIRPGLVDAYHD